MFGKVTKIGQSDPKFGTWFDIQTDNGMFQCNASPNIDISSLRVGSEATFQVDSKTNKAGKPYSKLLSFSFAGSAPISAATKPVTSSGLSEPEMRFVSGVVQSAIQASMMHSPSDIKLWFDAAKSALRGE